MYESAEPAIPSFPERPRPPWGSRKSLVTPVSVMRSIMDAEELGPVLPGWAVTTDQIGGGPSVAEVQSLDQSGLQCSHFRLNCDLHFRGRTSSTGRGLFVFLGSAGDWCRDKQPLVPGTFLLWRPDDPLDVFARSQAEAISMAVPEAVLRSSLASAGDESKAAGFLAGREMQAPPRALRLFQEQVVGLLEATGREASEHALQRTFDEPWGRCLASLCRLLEASAPLPRGSTRGDRPRVVREAESFMERSLDQPITTQEICDAIEVSRRTLFYAFEELYGISPMRYLRAKRLNRVRRELRHAENDRVSIQQIARRWFVGHSAFASQYVKLFGELPSQSLARRLDGPIRPSDFDVAPG